MVSAIKRKLARFGVTTLTNGDCEATFFMPWDKALEVAKMLKFVKGSQNGSKNLVGNK